MLSCKEASHLISMRQERPLGFRERWGVRMHLWICVGCRGFERQLTVMRQVLRELGRRAETANDSGEFPAEVRERIRKAIAERNNCKHDHAN